MNKPNLYQQACINSSRQGQRLTHEVRLGSEITPEEQDNFVKMTRAEKRAFERQNAKRNKLKITKFGSYK